MGQTFHKITDGDFFKNGFGENLVLRKGIIREAEEYGIAWNTIAFLIYQRIRWYETDGKFGFMTASEDYLADMYNLTSDQVHKALKTLVAHNAIAHVWCDKSKFYHYKSTLWVSTTKLNEAKVPIESVQILKKGSKNAMMLTDNWKTTKYKKLSLELQNDEQTVLGTPVSNVSRTARIDGDPCPKAAVEQQDKIYEFVENTSEELSNDSYSARASRSQPRLASQGSAGLVPEPSPTFPLKADNERASANQVRVGGVVENATPFEADVKNDNPDRSSNERKSAYALARQLLMELRPHFGNFTILNRHMTQAKRVLDEYTYDEVMAALKSYRDADWIPDENKTLEKFLCKNVIARFCNSNQMTDVVEDTRTQTQKDQDEMMMAHGHAPMFMGKSLMKQLGIWKKYHPDED